MVVIFPVPKVITRVLELAELNAAQESVRLFKFNVPFVNVKVFDNVKALPNVTVPVPVACVIAYIVLPLLVMVVVKPDPTLILNVSAPVLYVIPEDKSNSPLAKLFKMVYEAPGVQVPVKPTRKVNPET